MSGYVQIGVAALRDPKTRMPLPAVPLYVRTGDAEKLPQADIGTLAGDLAGKMDTYLKELKALGLGEEGGHD